MVKLPTNPRIIAFTGPKACGKDTMAQVLLRQNNGFNNVHYNYFARTPFAQGVKTICNQVFGWPLDLQDDSAFKETVLEEWPHVAPRWPMMDIANWFRDKYGPDVWVHTLARRIAAYEETNPFGAYVITDLRFPNELEWLKRQPNAWIVYVYRDEAEQKLQEAKATGDAMALNPSEAHYDLIKAEADLVLANNQEIYKAHNTLLQELRVRFGHFSYWLTEVDNKEGA